MGDWHSANFQDGSAEDLWRMFGGFHDFRVASIAYSASDDLADLTLEYDDGILAVLLRFGGNVSMNRPPSDYEVDWISKATIHEVRGQIQWTACEPYEISPDDAFQDVTFVRGDSLKWAVLDESGNRIPMPDSLILPAQ